MITVLTLFIMCYFPALNIIGDYFDKNPTEKMQATIDFEGRDVALSILSTAWKFIIATSIALALIEMLSSKKSEETFSKNHK